MPENTPARRDVLKYAGASGGALIAGGWLSRPDPAFAAADANPDDLDDLDGYVDHVGQHLGTPLDTLTFGNAASETAHGLTATLSDTVTGGLSQSARVLHPTSPATYWGGTLSFTMACSPTDTTYVTVKLWGDEYDPTSLEESSGNNSWRLQLFCEGLQVGYEDQGAVDCLDILDTAPRLPGRFFFHTLPLPEKMTQGRTSVSLEIRSMGRIWSYGQNQAQLYYNQTTDSRGVYQIYTTSDPFITFDKKDVQGPVPVPGVRTTPGPEVLDAIKARVQSDQTYLLTGAAPNSLGGWSMQALAEGYLWSGSPAYRSGSALDLVMQAIDGRYWAWKQDPTVLTGSDQQWQGFGRVGLVLALLWENLGDWLDQQLAGAPTGLANTGFELGGATPMYWTAPGWGTSNATWARDTTVSRSGGASLKFTVNAAGGHMVVNSTPNTQVTAGETYTFGAWIKTDGASGQTADIDPLFFDGAGNLVGTDTRVWTATGVHDWQYVSADVKVPAGASQASLYLNLNQAGTVWFDDVTFYKATEISNPGFEDGGAQPASWTAPGWGTNNATWSRDTTVSRSGGASLNLTGSVAGSTIVVTQTRFTAVSAGIYTFGAWIKTDGTSGQTADIDPLFFDANGTLVGSDHRAFTTTGAHDWEYVSINVAVPSGATQAQLYLNLNGAGTVWFDDITLTPPASATVTVPVRRDAYTDMLLSSREYWRQHFPHYSNQTQICATGLYQANRGLRLLGYSGAWSEDKARSYLYESIGMVPFQGFEDAAGNPNRELGTDYHEVSAKGLTRELGFVGSYGEVTDWLIMMYESVTRGYQGQDAPELAAQMVKMIKARGYFHPVDVDGAGARVARVETVIGWRNEAYPGIVNYAERTVWDSNPLMAAVTFADADLIGWTQEMFADGQFWVQLDLLTANSWDRVGLNALRLVSRDWPAYQGLPTRPNRLPTGWDEPDFVFTDEDTGAIAVKNGREFLYASLYWRARQGVNNYARIHHLTPQDQHSATIREVSAGLTGDSFTAQDWILWDYAIADPAAGGIPPGGFPPPGGDSLHQSQAGDVYYKAPVAAGVDPSLGLTFTGVEEMLVGHAPFYVMQYGPYLVAMNSSTDTTFTLPQRHGFGAGTDLATGKVYGAGTKIPIGPKSTLVLYSQRGVKQHR